MSLPNTSGQEVTPPNVLSATPSFAEPLGERAFMPCCHMSLPQGIHGNFSCPSVLNPGMHCLSLPVADTTPLLLQTSQYGFWLLS